MFKNSGGIIVSYWHRSSTVTLQNSYNVRISLCIFIFFTLVSCLPQQKEDLTVKSSRKPTAHGSLVSKVLNAIFAKDLALFLVQAIRSQVLLPLLTSKGCAETSLKSSKTRWPTSVLYDCKEMQKLKLPVQLGWAFYCLWLLVTGQSQLQPQQLRIFVEAHFLQSKFRAIEEARIPGNDAVRKSFQCLSSFIGFVTFIWWKMPKSHEGKNKELD